jgi:predicted membrane channel-forming protein YqfA (hemolysin III family)
MDFTFPWPTTNGEWLALGAASVTVLLGLVGLFVPWLALRMRRLQTVPDHPEALAAARTTMAGFYLGVGCCAILLAQPLVYLTLGFSWLFSAFGRLISILSDRGATLLNVVSLLAELVLSALPLAFALGFIP